MKYSDAIIECNKRILKAEILRNELLEKVRELDKLIEDEQKRIRDIELLRKE